MIDGNQLILNQVTLCKAVEYWLNKDVLKNDIEVSAINYSASDCTFEVAIAI